MPMLTREMIIQQQIARKAAQLSTPSTPSSHSSSLPPSLTSSPSSTTSSLSHSSGSNPRTRSSSNKCWIPTLDEVSRASPDGCARIFARLAREAQLDAQFAVPKTPERKVKPPTSMYPPTDPKEYSTAAIGAAALDLIRPCIDRPVEHPTMPTHGWGDLDNLDRMEIEDQQMFSEWLVDIPDSPVTSSFRMNDDIITEGIIDGWMREDVEMETAEKQAQNDILRKLGYTI